jgi:hypothetical protein
MSNLSWDLWGALIYAPLLTLATILLARRMFTGALQPVVAVIVVGFVLKVAGAMARYWVAFTAYGGASDAARYHDAGSMTAGLFWSRQIDLWALIPSGSNTVFVEGVAGLVYSFIGTSQLAAFVVFAWFGFVGVMCFIKAACVSVPGLAQRRYAWLCVAMPSVVYWPASLGKESLMIVGLGLGSLGVARLFERGGFLRGLLLTVIGFGFVGFIRPHIAGVFIAGVLPGLMVAFRRPAAAAAEWRPVPGAVSVEIWLQVRQVDHPHHPDRPAAEKLLGDVAGQRIRLLGECEPRGFASALEPGQRAADRHERARADAAVQRLWRVRGRPLQQPPGRTPLGLKPLGLKPLGLKPLGRPVCGVAR